MPDKMAVFAAVLSGFLFMAFAASENRRSVPKPWDWMILTIRPSLTRSKR